MKFRAVLSYVLLAVLFVSGAFAAISKKDLQNLPQNYRDWITRDVTYIATDEEKTAFVHLSTDAERDQFIEHFWAVRNPTPGSPGNPYRDEIYRRIAYADQWYNEGHTEGWRTDRGRVYITLGAPTQDAKYLGFANIHPMIIWFYSNDNPALPPFFYVVFYQRDAGGDFRLYSPFMDGPDKVVTGASGSAENNPKGSLAQIDHDAGREVARTMVSLIPNEPVDIQNPQPSLASDQLLNNIRNLANHPLNKEMLNQKRQLLESVSHRVVLGADYLDVLTVPLVAPSGETNLHYVVRLKRPTDFSIAEDTKDKRYYYTATIATRVMTPEGKLIFSQQRKLSQFVNDKEYVSVKNRVFGYEGLLPLPPGKYKLDFTLTNELAHTSFHSDRVVAVPERPIDSLRITDVVPFTEATSGEPAYLPFSVAGLRFTPAMEGLTLVPGHDLQFFYQMWAPAKDKEANPQDKLAVEYAYGRMGMHDIQSVKDEVAREQFDDHGALISGKKIATAALQPGNYRMAITVTDPTTHARSVASFQFHIADQNASLPIWDVTDPDAAEEVKLGTREYQRAQCYIMQGDSARAIVFLHLAYQKSGDEATRDKLIGLLYSRGAYAEIVDLYQRGGVTPKTDEQTLLAIAESLSRTGRVAKSIQLLESAAPGQQSSALYLSLARYYQASGDAQKASDMERKAKAMSAQPTT